MYLIVGVRIDTVVVRVRCRLALDRSIDRRNLRFSRREFVGFVHGVSAKSIELRARNFGFAISDCGFESDRMNSWIDLKEVEIRDAKSKIRNRKSEIPYGTTRMGSCETAGARPPTRLRRRLLAPDTGTSMMSFAISATSSAFFFS